MRSLRFQYKCVYFSELIFDLSGDDLFDRYPLEKDDPIRDVIIVLDQDAIKSFLLEAHIKSGNLLYAIDDFVAANNNNSTMPEAKKIWRLIRNLVCNDRTSILNNLQNGKASIRTLSRFAHLLRSTAYDDYQAIVVDTIPVKGLTINTKYDKHHYFSKVPFMYRSDFERIGNEYRSNYRTLLHIDTFEYLARLLSAVTYTYNYNKQEGKSFEQQWN